MNGIKKIALALGFTRKRSEFELLETEKGGAGLFWRLAVRGGAEAGRKKDSSSLIFRKHWPN